MFILNADNLQPVSFTNWDDLVLYMSEQDSNTEFETVSSPEDLDPDNKQYKYTLPAFYQACRILSPGLISVMSNLLTPPDNDQSPDPKSAKDIFKYILKTKFDNRLNGYRLLIDKPSQTIQGLIGPGYRWLSNNDFLYLLEQVISSTKAELKVAYKRGRKIGVYFYDPSNNKEFQETTYNDGYYAVNSEAGDSSAYLTYALNETDYFALAHMQAPKCSHSGRDLRKRLCSSMMTVVKRANNNLENLYRCMQKHSKHKIDVPDGWGHVTNETKHKELVFKLQMYGVHLQTLNSIFSTMNPETANIYTLFKAIIQHAKNMIMPVREKLEHAAWLLLTS